MMSGVPILLFAAAQVAEPSAAASTAEPAAPPEACRTPDVKPDTREIVVCAPRPQGYRIDPDILEAERLKKRRNRPRPPERLADTSCKTVGPAGCMEGPGINVIAAAVTAATMVSKAVKGENVGKMFITDPQPSDYELYLEAKRRREAKEAEQAAAAKAKAAANAKAAAAAEPESPQN